VIESASFPADLGTWDEDAQPYYFEVYGETEPLLDMRYGEVLSEPTRSAVYEYWWTIGHGGHGPLPHHVFGDRADQPVWERLADPAARVYLYFPLYGGWRAKELVATVKYLNPVQDQKNWSARIADEVRTIQPVVSGAASVGAAIAPELSLVPAVGPLLAGTTPYLSALAKMKPGSVPPDMKGFEWHVMTVAFGSPPRGGVMSGVSWVLPRAMFQTLGSRITGSLAVSFMPSKPQREPGEFHPRPAPALAHAVVYADGKEHWAPAINDFVELTIAPQLPS
jgi:hypothetical protein